MGSNRFSLGETLGKPVCPRISSTIKFHERGVRNSNWYLSPGLSSGGIPDSQMLKKGIISIFEVSKTTDHVEEVHLGNRV